MHVGKVKIMLTTQLYGIYYQSQMCLWISEPLIYFYHLQMFDIHIVTLKVLMAVTIKIIIFGILVKCSPIGHKLLNYVVSDPRSQHLLNLFKVCFGA